MNKFIVIPIFILFQCFLFSENSDFISKNTFIDCADHYIHPRGKFDPKQVKEGDIVCVYGKILYYFFDHLHDKIENGYILVTIDHDFPIPGRYVEALNDDNLIAWFGLNVENTNSPKMHLIPIGIDLRKNKYADLSSHSLKLGNYEKKNLFYMNFCIGTNPRVRSYVRDLFINKSYCYFSKPKEYKNYIKDLSESCFVLSPRGGGLDCYRTWEALYAGSIPVVRNSSIDALYTELPILVIEDWEEVTEELLKRKYKEISERNYNTKKLTSSYWSKMIQDFASKYKE